MSEVLNKECMPEDSLQLIRFSDFQPHLGEDFIIHFSADVKTGAQLETILELPVHSSLERKPFSIILQTDQHTKYYPQSIYTIEHPVVGKLDIFLVPVGVKERGVQYEAVFS